MIRDGDQIWSKGKDVATPLGYQDTDKAVRNHVDVDNKKKVQQKATRRFGGVVKSMVILTSVRQVYTLWSSLRQLRARGCNIRISSDLHEVIHFIEAFMAHVRYLCDRCNRRFKSETTLYSHQKWIHRVR